MKIELIGKKEIVSGVWEISFNIKDQNFSFEAGQYIRLVLSKLDFEDTKGPARLFSIASLPSEREKLDIIFRDTGSGFKKTLLNMAIGEEAEIEGPFGSFTFPSDTAKQIVFIAGGTGITPFLSMIRYAFQQKLPHRITLLYVSRDKNNIAYSQELKILAKQISKLKIIFAYGLLTEKLIRKNSPKDFDALFYISGPPAMLDSSRAILEHNNASGKNIYYEEWSTFGFFNPVLMNIIEIVPDAIFYTDLTGIIQYVNPAWEKLSGWTAEEIVGKHTPRIQKSDKQSSEYYKELWNYHLRGKVFQKDVINKRKDGSLYEIDHVYIPIFSEAKQIVGFGGLQREISEEKTKHYKQTQAIMESLGEGLIAVDKGGVISTINDAAKTMLGWDESVIGKKWHELLRVEKEDGEYVEPEKRPILVALATGEKINTAGLESPLYYVRKDGTRFPVMITATPVKVWEDIVGAVVVFRDITKQRQNEKLRSDFLSLASHQLRTPLSGIKWLIETVQREVVGSVTQKQKEYLDQIYQMNERMIKLVFDMLNVLRLEAGAAFTKKEKVSITNVYKEVSLMVELAAKKAGVSIRNAADGREDIVLETDAVMLRNLLECFISNAINYSLPKQEVIFDAKEEVEAIVISVKDSGIGIPKDEKENIFGKFYRASNAKEFKPNGTGLGLYIASMLAERIGANISFESEKGKGSVFYLRIPK